MQEIDTGDGLTDGDFKSTQKEQKNPFEGAMMKFLIALAASAASLVAVPANAALMLTLVPSGGLKLDSVKAGDALTFDVRLSGNAGESLNPGGGTLGLDGVSNLGFESVSFPDFFADASLNPIVARLFFKAGSAGPATAVAQFVGVTTTSGFGTLKTNAVTFNIASVSSAVPEPATWAMMIAGFAVVGGAMRRRKVNTAVRFA